MRYPKYATTVIGAHSVPDWYEALDRLVAVGQLSMASMADAQYRATPGRDPRSGARRHRRRHRRRDAPAHAQPPFAAERDAEPLLAEDSRPSRAAPGRSRSPRTIPNVFHPAATCRARISDNIDLGLVDEFKTVSALTRKPVKITMTGPHMLAKVAYDEHYNDIAQMMADLGKLLRHNFKMLAEAGCKHIQIDEPLFTMSDDEEVQAAVDAINLAIEGLPDDIHVSTHICQGNYAVGKEYDAQIGHRYFDTGRYKADLVCKIECSSYLIEYDMTHHYEGLLGNRQLGVGAVDVQDPKVESGETVAARIREHKLARARADHRDQLLRLQSPAAAGRRSASCRRWPRPSACSAGSDVRAAHRRRSGRGESEELLALAQEAGRLGVFEWQVQAGTVRLSPKFLALYGLTEFRRPLRELARLRLPRGSAPRSPTSSTRPSPTQAREFADRIPHRPRRATARCAGSRRAASSSTTRTARRCASSASAST